MNKFSLKSQQQLASCHPNLQRIFNQVIKHVDCTIIEGHRGEAAQNRAFEAGNSKLKWPHGKHNQYPSMAVDAAPYPVEFPQRGDSEEIVRAKLMRFARFAGRVEQIASELGIKIRWGGDWDMDFDLKDNVFDDLVHFELITD